MVRSEKLLILCKTYPSPSAKHAETSCVAAMRESGELVRLFPVPFRFISDERQFRKWQWIEAKTEKSTNDHRPESFKLYVDTIEPIGDPIPTNRDWRDRRELISRLPLFDDFSSLEAARQDTGISLALLRPSEILSLSVTPAATPEWTQDELDKLLQAQRQAGLFDSPSEDKAIRLLRKLPHDFHYHYRCASEHGVHDYKNKIVDWEAGALYWNVVKAYGPGWETPFRDKLEVKLPSQDLMFLMGTIHRFPDQWLIVSLIYPPKLDPTAPTQPSLFDQ